MLSLILREFGMKAYGACEDGNPVNWSDGKNI